MLPRLLRRVYFHLFQRDDHSFVAADDVPVEGVMRLRAGKDGGMPHFCYPLVDPAWVDVAEATHMKMDDPVLGLVHDEHAWALPWWIMKNHHFANLVLNDRPMHVSLCEMCSSAAAFDPVINGRRHTFRLEGIYNGTLMPTDYETESLWAAFTGQCIHGEMKGAVMDRLPLMQCTWKEWIEEHPHTQVPDGAGESREGHGATFSPGSPGIGQRFKATIQHADDRLPHNEMVLGVSVNGASRCYPVAELTGQGNAVINDTLGGEEIAVFSRPGSIMAVAYSRRHNGNVLSFQSDADGIFDEATNSRWEISGRASSGPLADQQLKYVYSGVEEFYVWATFQRESDVYHAALAS